MVHTKNPLYKTILVFNLIFVLPCAAASVYGVINFTDPFSKLSAACMIASLICAFIYIVKGYSKGQAKLYKAFEFLFILAIFATLIVMVICAPVTKAVNFVIEIAIFGLVVSLASAKDLGKTKSLVMCGAVVVLDIVNYLGFAVVDHSGISASVLYSGIIRGVSEILLCIILGICTFAKYVDKTTRGTK